METNTNSPLNTPSIPNLYSTIFQQTAMAIEVYDKNGLLVDANPACLKLFGVQSLSDVKQFPLFDDPNVSDEAKAELLQGKPVHYNTTFSFDAVKTHAFYSSLRSGSIEIYVQISPIYDAKHILSGYLCVISDISEMKKMTDSIRESEQLYKSAFQDHTAVKLIIDPDNGNITDANRAAVQFYGWSAEQLRSIRIQDINTLTEEEVSNEMQNARNNKRTFFRFQHRLANGSIRDVEVFSSTIKVNDKELLHSIVHDVTEKKHVEEALQENRQRLEFALESGGLGVWDWNPHTGAVVYSNHWAQMLEYRPDEVEPTVDFFKRHIHPEDMENVLDRLARHVEGHIPVYESEHRLRTKSGRWLWVMDRGKTVERDKDGSPVRVTGIISNITERKHTANMLQKNMEWLDETTKIAKVGGWMIDLAGNTLEWTKETFRLHELPYGAPPDVSEAIEFYHPEDRPRVAAAVQRAIESGEDFDFEARTITAKNNLIWVHAMGHTVSSENRLVRVQGTVQDITERKRAEDATAAEKERLAVTLRSIGDGVITTDMNGNVVLMNNVAENLTGWKQDEAEGKSLLSVFEIINETTRKPHENPVQKVLSTGKVIELANHTLLIARDGTERIISDSGAPIKDKDGHTIGVVLVFRDMTEKHRLLEITQNTQKLESLGVLAGGIAHDFNNLLGGIFGYIDMASEQTKEEKVTSYLSKSMNTIDRARALTGQLLTFAKGGAPIQKIDHLYPFIEETARFALSGSSVSCNFDVPQDLWLCNYDKNQIGQVIDNLIINAQQAMPVGGTIELTARNSALAEKEHPALGKGNYIKLSVKDYGVGIPKEMIAKIFDPFYTTKTKGHGLGLATCYSIINRHGGCIDVDSEPGKGTTFNIYLPASMESTSSGKKNADKTHKGSGTILVMDDEEVMRETVSDMLKMLGYTVVCKENGKDAVELFAAETKANRKIAGIIFDLTVPGGMGGKAAIEEIRKFNTDVPAFVASGYADDPVMKNPVEHGFTASISKPFRKSELSEMLNKYMQPKK